MDIQDLTRKLKTHADTKTVLVVADGLGGLPQQAGGKTELEAASTPTLDRLAANGISGLLDPVGPGITCGSGPGHLALFGYDPVEYAVGRGVLSALGVDFELQPGDVAARGNFCTIDEQGRVSDRRAGRIDDEKGRHLVKKLQSIEIEGVEIHVRHVKEYRFALILRGEDLAANLSDTDPRETGVSPHEVTPADKQSSRTAEIVSEFLQQTKTLLRDERPANMALLRGFDSYPEIPSLKECYGLAACAVAIYPMYRGLSRLLGMDVPSRKDNLDGQIEDLRSRFDRYDFFFLHHKSTDSLGEDGDFEGKLREIEKLDSSLEQIVSMKPDVLVVTGDHSTPAALKNHSWHPVPAVLAASNCRPDRCQTFGEREATGGGLGRLPMKYLMPTVLAHANRLDKFGA